jgi:hypothetical protein
MGKMHLSFPKLETSVCRVHLTPHCKVGLPFVSSTNSSTLIDTSPPPHPPEISGIIHVASEVSTEFLQSNPEKAIEATAASVVGLMKAAANVPSVKSFVLTSSSVTVMATRVESGKEVHFSTEMFQEHVIEVAKSLPDDFPAEFKWMPACANFMMH